MTINYAESYQQGLQKHFSENGVLYSQRLWSSPSNNLLKWIGQKTVKVPKLTITEGRKDRARRTVVAKDVTANYSNEWITYELTNERFWQTLVDPSDIDENNWTTTIANITRSFNDQEKVPEMDAQMFSSLFAKTEAAVPDNIYDVEIETDNILDTFDTMMTEMDEQSVPANRVLYVTPQVKKILKNAEGLMRTLNVGDRREDVSRIISRLDNIELIDVPSNRFKTAYDFTEGAVEAPGSKQIQMMLIHIPSMAAPQKYTFAGLDEPSAATSGNYHYYEQCYDDVLVFEGKEDGIAFAVK
ncbi:MAG: capsid protein [Streptococcaceae bacterium]|nr:capsid protein [Streptococcaceae bacterium]MCL2680892.1 capsid protein [Streptococcaceae bacterium]MCL2858088.1 capsid protein [Streptococcaceae bacterium]